MIVILLIAGVFLCISVASALALRSLLAEAFRDDEPQPETDPERVAANHDEETRLTLAFLSDDEAQWEAEQDEWRRAAR